MTQSALDGCHLKVERARTHLAALGRAIDAVTGTEPDLLTATVEEQTGDYVLRAVRHMHAPLELSGMVGDVVHNLAAALDYLAWELVGANGQTGDGQTAFPIFQRREEWAAPAHRVVRKLKGMAPAAQLAIEQAQPFQVPWSRAHPSEHPLAQLYALEQWDKHRTLVLTTNTISAEIHGWPTGIHVPPGPHRGDFGPHEPGQELARIRGFERGLTFTMEVRHEIRFGRESPAAAGELVVPALARIRDHVQSTVLPAFHWFF